MSEFCLDLPHFSVIVLGFILFSLSIAPSVQAEDQKIIQYTDQALRLKWYEEHIAMDVTTCIPEFEHGPSTAVGDVTIAQSNPDIVWIGLGRPTFSGVRWQELEATEGLGLNRVVWSLTKDDGQFVEPGTYTIDLSTEAVKLEEKIEVKQAMNTS